MKFSSFFIPIGSIGYFSILLNQILFTDGTALTLPLAGKMLLEQDDHQATIAERRKKDKAFGKFIKKTISAKKSGQVP